MPDLLSIQGLRAGYGEAVVLPDMSLALADGQVLALLGRNGTGKKIGRASCRERV